MFHDHCNHGDLVMVRRGFPLSYSLIRVGYIPREAQQSVFMHLGTLKLRKHAKSCWLLQLQVVGEMAETMRNNLKVAGFDSHNWRQNYL